MIPPFIQNFMLRSCALLEILTFFSTNCGSGTKIVCIYKTLFDHVKAHHLRVSEVQTICESRFLDTSIQKSNITGHSRV